MNPEKTPPWPAGFLCGPERLVPNAAEVKGERTIHPLSRLRRDRGPLRLFPRDLRRPFGSAGFPRRPPDDLRSSGELRLSLNSAALLDRSCGAALRGIRDISGKLAGTGEVKRDKRRELCRLLGCLPACLGSTNLRFGRRASWGGFRGWGGGLLGSRHRNHDLAPLGKSIS